MVFLLFAELCILLLFASERLPILTALGVVKLVGGINCASKVISLLQFTL